MSLPWCIMGHNLMQDKKGMDNGYAVSSDTMQ